MCASAVAASCLNLSAMTGAFGTATALASCQTSLSIPKTNIVAAMIVAPTTMTATTTRFFTPTAKLVSVMSDPWRTGRPVSDAAPLLMANWTVISLKLTGANPRFR